MVEIGEVREKYEVFKEGCFESGSASNGLGGTRCRWCSGGGRMRRGVWGSMSMVHFCWTWLIDGPLVAQLGISGMAY